MQLAEAYWYTKISLRGGTTSLLAGSHLFKAGNTPDKIAPWPHCYSFHNKSEVVVERSAICSRRWVVASSSVVSSFTVLLWFKTCDG